MNIIEKKKSKGSKNISLTITMPNESDKLIAKLKILGRTNPPNGGERMRYIMFEKDVEISNVSELHSLLWPEINSNRALQGIDVILDELCAEAKK
ncbi:hypothetical protein [Escherichia coli]|uniref:hypothetical protein n=1 Tax=Enterobacteriaceae TaxID=543 RepID=UPI0022A3F6ED|nr:hypothetical protein [Escherichia coli]MEC5710786.1 hypothetical protein [Escherichia coli]HCU2346485.1 hypothetical protein [Citrobacter freundii]HEE9957081.1 hypothetical protein [Citrobacter freundii]